MAGDRRHVYGPRPIAALVPALTRQAFRRRSPGTAQILADWPAIVGPALASVTTPRGLKAGTLTIACPGPIALELQHLADELRARVNGAVGAASVARLRFVQNGPPAAPPLAPEPVDARAEREAERATASLPAGALHDALAALGRAVLTERAARSTR